MKNKKQVASYTLVIIFLLLAVYNLNKVFEKKKVLGIETTTTEVSNDIFWKEFLKSNPNYLPGYIELNEIEKVERLDPNFIP